MEKDKVIGSLLLILAAFTAAGIFFDSPVYWLFYDCAVIFFSFLGAIILLRKK